MLGGTAPWFALYSKPHKEYFVRDHLGRQGIEVYLPEVSVAYPRRERRPAKPFFPHYLFARLDPLDARMADLRWTPGLRAVVSANGQPVPVPDDVISLLRQRLATMAPLREREPFREGERVRVTSGPFEGLEAVFDRRLSPQGRARVFLQLISRWVAAELDIEDLQPVR